MINFAGMTHRVIDTVQKFLHADWGNLLLVAIGWQVTYTLIGWSFNTQLPLLDHMLHWDAGWYQSIINYAYVGSGDIAGSPAFYPLFPLLVSIIHWLFFGLISIELAGLLLNTAALWLALVALWRILASFSQSRTAKIIAIAAFLAFPSAFFMHVFYSESLFVALGFWAYLLARQHKWLISCILLAVLTASRLPSLLFVGLVGLEYLRAYDWNIKRALSRQALYFLLAPIGFVIYGLYLEFARGDFLAMFHAYSAVNDWSYQIFNPNIIATIVDSARVTGLAIFNHEFNYFTVVNHLLPLLSLIAILAASIVFIAWRQRRELPLATFGLTSIVFFSLNSNLISVHRYTLACLTIYCAVPLAWKYRWAKFAIPPALILSFIIGIILFSKFTAGTFAG